MTWLSAGVLLLAIVFATFVSAISLALQMMSRAALGERTRGTENEHRAAWLIDRLDDARLSVAFVRTVLRLTVFSLILVEVMGYDTAITWPRLVLAGAIGVGTLWGACSVVATSIARHATYGLVAWSLPLVRVTTVILVPLTRSLAFVDEAIRRLSGANLREEREEAEAELLRSIEESQREGGLDEHAATLLENVVEFSTTDVGEVMTPRTDIDGLAMTDDLAAIRTFIGEVGHSRIPVYGENLDDIVGVLYVKDLIPYLGQDAAGFELGPVLRQPIVVPETKQVGELLADFQRSEVHLAIVIDEYGGTAGLVTIEDVLEEIVGEIQDEHDSAEEEPPALTPVGPNRVAVDGRYHIDDLNEELGLDLPEDAEFDTVAGFVLATLGRVPAAGESFEAHDARFVTMEATPTHVARLEVELLNGSRSAE